MMPSGIPICILFVLQSNMMMMTDRKIRVVDHLITKSIMLEPNLKVLLRVGITVEIRDLIMDMNGFTQ